MSWRKHRRGYITIAVATGLFSLAVAMSPLFPDPMAGDAPWIPDPRLVAVRDVAWFTAVATAVWLSVVETIEHLGRRPHTRWVAVGAAAGLAAGAVLGLVMWWLERPRVLAPGEQGIVVMRGELFQALGPWPINQFAAEAARLVAGDAGYLLLAPPIAWGVLGGGIGSLVMACRAAFARVQPNDR